MKAPSTILTALLLIAPCPAADEIDEAVSAIGLLPSQRSGQHITPQERNPFAVRPKEVSKIVQSEETETQESRIRAIFKLIEVTGVRRDSHGRLMALAADLILREGEEVKPVMPDQTETLMVSKVGPDQVELTFIETKDSTQPRTIPLPVKNKVLVSQKLFGQPKGQRNFYTVTGKKATDPAVAAAMISAQQVPGGAAAAASAWQAPPVSIVSAMAGLTGLFPQAPAGDEGRSAAAAASAGAANPTAQVQPAPPPGTVDPTAVAGSVPVAAPPATSDSGSTAPGPAAPAAPAPTAPRVPAVVAPVPAVPAAVPAPAAPQVPMPAPPASGAMTPGVPAAALAPAPGMAAPPTYLRRHGEQPSAEPEARAARPAVPPPAPGSAPAVVE